MNTKKEAFALIELANRLVNEGEGITIDNPYTLEEIVRLRSYLSSTRKAIDIANKGLAKLWADDFPGEAHQDEHTDWYLGVSKGKKLVDPDAFYAWMETLDAERLKKLISISSIKVSGMDKTERSTFLDEQPTSANLSIQHKPRRF